MYIVVLKSEEDLLLSDCDNSCSSGDECVCKTVLGMNNSGQGMYDYGLSKCVLCYRSSYVANTKPPFNVVPDGYPKHWLLPGVPFIRFNKNDYKVKGTRYIEQVITGEITPLSWLSSLYETNVVKVPEEDTRWFLSVCDTRGCKQVIHSYVNEHRAIGIDNSYMDLSSNSVKCKFCNKNLRYIDNNSEGIVCYGGVDYAKCRFCNTIVKYDSSEAVQICTCCLKIQQDNLKMMERICLYCSNTVSGNKKGGSQSIAVRCSDNNVKDMYLCRHHKIKSLVDGKIYDYNDLINMIK